MPGEEFDRQKHYNGPFRTDPTKPMVNVHAAGVLSLNRLAVEALGDPDGVILLFDDSEKVIGIRACSPDDPRAALPRRPNRRSMRRIVGAITFLKQHGVDYSKTRRYPARMDGDILVVPLPEKVTGVAKRRGEGE